MWDDLQLRDRVRQELDWDRHIDAHALSVWVQDGVVTLEGSVNTATEVHVAREVARRVTGIVDLANLVEIKRVD